MENNLKITRRKILSLAAAGLSAPFLVTRASAAPSPVLVELFTSQGCSSCPPADRLAGVLATQADVTVISFNVDYWDYLGWRDTLANPANTKRQMDYAHARGDNDVYTPQMVINGVSHVVGSNRGSVENAISNARRSVAPLALRMTTSGSDIKIELPDGEAAEATLWVMAISSTVDVKIERGENLGKTITYHNVVRQLSNVAKWNGTSSSIMAPRKKLLSANSQSCIAVLQKGLVGPLIGIGKFTAAAT